MGSDHDMAEVTGEVAGGGAGTLSREPRWRRAPWRGLWTFALSVGAVLVYMLVLVPALGIPDADATLNYPTLFFLWGFSWFHLFERWPFHKLKQPWSAVAGVVLIWILVILTWAWLQTVMDPAAANAISYYALFPVFILCWFSDDLASVIPLRQPVKGILLLGWSVLFGWLVYTQIGIVAQVWLWFIPVWYLYFLEGWPLTPGKQSRGTWIAFWVLIVMVVTWLFNYFHDMAGVPMSSTVGNDLESLIWTAMTPVYVCELILFAPGKQPWKGMGLILFISGSAAVFAVLYYYVFHAPDWWISRWIFALWVWIIIFQWLPLPWPSKHEAVVVTDR
jgi:hypothetical protein